MDAPINNLQLALWQLDSESVMLSLTCIKIPHGKDEIWYQLMASPITAGMQNCQIPPCVEEWCPQGSWLCGHARSICHPFTICSPHPPTAICHSWHGWATCPSSYLVICPLPQVPPYNRDFHPLHHRGRHTACWVRLGPVDKEHHLWFICLLMNLTSTHCFKWMPFLLF